MSTDTDTADLLAQLRQAQAELAQAKRAMSPEQAARVAKASVTRAANAARVPYRRGDTVRVNAPRSPRYHGRELTVTGINPDVTPGEVQAEGVWFALTEVTKVPRTRTTTTTTK